jgi:NAD(P)-dependent dehydrogenase (short-subunit alcohol dehydrogenase family)
MRLTDKVAIVTGGAHGMGEAEARLFAAEGARVIVADILESEAEIVASDIRAGRKEAMAAKIDVTSEGQGRWRVDHQHQFHHGVCRQHSGHPAYHASKGAVRIYSKAAAVRYGPSGVRVNTVHPGYMPPMLNATNANERADKIAATPLRRIGKPIEVAYGVLFLASDEASFITGTELVIDGGFIAQ